MAFDNYTSMPSCLLTCGPPPSETFVSDYDFSRLNDKEFEVFCTDLLSAREGVRFERFKPGRDAGVDGRFFRSEGDEWILQCKHWISTPLVKLVMIKPF